MSGRYLSANGQFMQKSNTIYVLLFGKMLIYHTRANALLDKLHIVRSTAVPTRSLTARFPLPHETRAVTGMGLAHP